MPAFNQNEQATFAAVYIMLIIWLLTLIFHPVINHLRKVDDARTDQERGATRVGGSSHEGKDTETEQRDTNGRVGGEKGKKYISICHLKQSTRDAFLILLGQVLLNFAGYGVTISVVILSWLSFGFLLIWCVALGSNLVEDRSEIFLFFLVLIFSVVNGGLAFRRGQIFNP
ncbi:hypothetical protein HDU92_001245 [Lobulomyces angularis]|nr:hypothetical protein HDU92_001245 [Lobulomyces angularis]